MLGTQGWKEYQKELERLHDQAVRMLAGSVDNHALMAKWSGRLQALREMLSFPDDVLKRGARAAKKLNGDTSSEDE